MDPKVRREAALGLTLGLGTLLLAIVMLSLRPVHFAHAQGPTTHYVAPDGNCGGASPCYASIQAAVDAAVDGDTVKAAQGVYRTIAFQVVYINKAITLTGGYAITDWISSYPTTRPTVIDAENVVRRRGVYIDGTGVATITLAGLTIQRGNAEGSGGGIHIVTGTVASNSKFDLAL